MKIILLILGLTALFINIKAFKGYFTPTKYRELEIKEKFNELGEYKDVGKLATVAVAVLGCLFYTILYVITGVVFSDVIPFVLLSLFLVFWTASNSLRLAKMVLKEDFQTGKGRSFLGKIVHPVSTLYILYFLYFVLTQPL